jgi:hypothetical protein
MKRPLMIAAALCMGLAAAACDYSGGEFTKTPLPQPPPPPPPPAPAFAENFGAGFAEAFQRGEFDEPRQIEPGDIIPVSFTDDPLEIPPDGG